MGGRGLEAYNNLIIGLGELRQGFKIRAGSGVVFNNTIQDILSGFWLLKAEWATDPQNYVHDLYIWNNTMTDVVNEISADPFYQEGVHYFLQEYKYTPYPHPLTLEE